MMDQPKPSEAEVKAVVAGMAWLQSTVIMGYAWGGTREEGQHLSAKSGAGPIWARYYSIETGKPVFGDRDKTIHDNVDELTVERKNGYAWYSAGAKEALDAYGVWKK